MQDSLVKNWILWECLNIIDNMCGCIYYYMYMYKHKCGDQYQINSELSYYFIFRFSFRNFRMYGKLK